MPGDNGDNGARGPTMEAVGDDWPSAFSRAPVSPGRVPTGGALPHSPRGAKTAGPGGGVWVGGG